MDVNYYNIPNAISTFDTVWNVSLTTYMQQRVNNPVSLMDTKISFVVYDLQQTLLVKYSIQTRHYKPTSKSRNTSSVVFLSDGYDIDRELCAWREETTLIPI
jgi:hypothetical protein